MSSPFKSKNGDAVWFMCSFRRAGRATARARGFGGRFRYNPLSRTEEKQSDFRYPTVLLAGPPLAYLRTAEPTRLLGT